MFQITIFLYHLIPNYYLMIHHIRQKRNIWLDISCNSIHGHQDHHQWLVVSHTQTFVGTYTLQVVVNETDDDFFVPLKRRYASTLSRKRKMCCVKKSHMLKPNVKDWFNVKMKTNTWVRKNYFYSGFFKRTRN